MELVRLVELLGQEIVHFALRATIVLLLVFCLTYLFRTKWSAARLHEVWVVCIGLIALLPVFYIAFPGWKILDGKKVYAWLENSFSLEKKPRVLTEPQPNHFVTPKKDDPFSSLQVSPEVQSLRAALSGEQQEEEFSPLVASVEKEKKASSSIPIEKSPVPQRNLSVYHGIGIIWILGVVYLGLSHSMGRWRLKKWIQRARQPAEKVKRAAQRIETLLQIERKVSLLVVEDLGVPMTCGVRRPKVLLPRTVESLHEKQIALILKHEFIHIKRADVLWGALGYFTLCMYWMNPLMWLGIKKMETLRERACDNWVLEGEMRKVKHYAQLLVNFAQRALQKDGRVKGALAMAQGEDLEERIAKLVSRKENRKRDGAIVKATVGIVVGILAFPMLSLKLKGEEKRAEKKETVYFRESASGMPGDSPHLHGELESLEGNTFMWRHPHAMDTLHVDASTVEAIDFHHTENIVEGSGSLLTLVNGDCWRGRLLSVDEQVVRLQRTHGEVVTFDRALLYRLVTPNVLTDLLYQGPKKEKEWEVVVEEKWVSELREKNKKLNWGTQFSKVDEKRKGPQSTIMRAPRESPHHHWPTAYGGWQSLQGSLQFSGNGGQNGESIKKEILPKGSFALSFNFFSEVPCAPTLSIAGYFLDLANFYKQKAVVKQEEINEERKLQFEIYYDHEEKKVAIYLDQKKIDTVKLIHKSAIYERALVFLMKETHPCRIDSISVHAWDGDEKKRVSLVEEKDRDQLVLTTGQVFSGTLRNLEKDNVVLTTKMGDISVALPRVREMYFAQRGERTLPRKEKSARVIFIEGTEISMEVKKINGERIEGKVPYLAGKQSFSKKEVQRLFFPSSSTKTIPHEDVLHFWSGEQVSGKIQRIEKETIFLRGGALLREVGFSTKDLRRIEIASQKRKGESHSTYVQLINGDILPGELKESGEETLLLVTDEGREEAIDLDMVQEISFFEEAKENRVLYEGPRGKEEWQKVETAGTGRGWWYQEESLWAQSQGIIAKELALPERVEIGFELHGKESLNLQLILFAEDIASLTHSDRYELHFYLNKVVFKNFHATAVSEPMPHTGVDISQFLQRQGNRESSTEIRLFIDQKTQEISLLINGQFVHTWQDKQRKEKWGNTIGLHAYAKELFWWYHDHPPKMQINKFTVSHWDGVLPLRIASIFSREDCLFLKDKQQVWGKVHRLGLEEVLFQKRGESRVSKIPRQEISRIKWAQKKKLTEQASAHVVFLNGGVLDLEIEHMEKGKITGLHSYFGKREIDINLVKEIRFFPPGEPVQQYSMR